MADGPPKDYSRMYSEDSNDAIHKRLDGAHQAPKQVREQAGLNNQSVDLQKVVAKLNQLPREDHSVYARDTLRNHYSSVFIRRRRDYKVHIQYFVEGQTYVVRTSQNTLAAVREKMPIRGNYRYFFRLHENTCEEIESNESKVPYHEKDGQKLIYCQVFPL